MIQNRANINKKSNDVQTVLRLLNIGHESIDNTDASQIDKIYQSNFAKNKNPKTNFYSLEILGKIQLHSKKHGKEYGIIEMFFDYTYLTKAYSKLNHSKMKKQCLEKLRQNEQQLYK